MDNPESQPLEPPVQVKGDVQELYDSLKPIIWKLYIENGKNSEENTILTAFAVRPKLLMTCGHGSWMEWQRRKISAKQFGGSKIHQGHIVAQKVTCEMVLIELATEGEGEGEGEGKGECVELERMEVGRFGSGKLEVGETLMVLGHPLNYFASGLVGRNLYPCVENPVVNFNDTLKCSKYKHPILQNPPKYRVMGDVFNAQIFYQVKADPNDTTDLTFQEKLMARIPVIQASGFICGPGSSGSPVFNIKGEIVGLHVYGFKGFEISIHVAALRAFLDNYLSTHTDGGAKKVGQSSKGKEVGQSSKGNEKKRKKQIL